MKSCSSKKFLNVIIEVSRSELEKSYALFQPMGPNFLRSWITAWKNLHANTSFFQGAGLVQLSKNSGGWLA